MISTKQFVKYAAFFVVACIALYAVVIQISLVDPVLTPLDEFVHSIKYGKQVLTSEPSTQSDCVRAGGSWEMRGWVEKSMECVFTAPDTGKRCFSGYQCSTGLCNAPLDEYEIPYFVGSGTCASERYRGCYLPVNFGTHVGGYCRD